MEEDPFKSVDTNKVYDRVLKRLTTDRSNNPRLSKYLFAGDDLDAVAFVSAVVENAKRDEYTAILNPGEGYDEFIQQLTQNMKGEIKTIWYVDRYTVQTDRARKKLTALVDSFRQTLGNIKFSLLTSFDPYNEGDRDRHEIQKKMKQICDSVHFMEDRGIAPHNRYIAIKTDKEVRWWSLPDGLVGWSKSSEICLKIRARKGVEEEVSAFIDSVGKKKEGGIIMSKTTIETITNLQTIDRTGESLGPIWTSSKSTVRLATKQGPFLFTGEGSEIPSSVSALIESSKERLLMSTQSLSDTTIIQAIEGALERGVRVYMVVDSTGFESILNNPSCNALHGNVLLRERQERGSRSHHC